MLEKSEKHLISDRENRHLFDGKKYMRIYVNMKYFIMKEKFFFQNDFLLKLKEEYKIPEYLLILLEVSKNSNEESLKRVVTPDPEKLRKILEEEGHNLLHTDYYYPEIVEKFMNSCKESFINLTKAFSLKAGDWDLFIHVQSVVINENTCRQSKFIFCA